VTTFRILLAGACVAIMVLAALVLIRSRRAGTARLFGRSVRRPRLWASAVLCVGLSGLLRIAGIEDVMPSSWQKSSGLIDFVLTLAVVVLTVAFWFATERDKRRRYRQSQAQLGMSTLHLGGPKELDITRSKG
jgi:cobalamin synthase